ncbi:MAG: biopolymer transport protein ExbD [Methanobacterium sp.]|jgi:biopolymer transport protein ExbD|uniref:ExbD/TolR family protein n=1 Tax=Methanobacterium sp. TaxID=2164 RepID=UPI0003C9BA9F|nr:biopolymer transporter ExbD [Methanobacterium sp.]MDI3549122.1 biopolymer transport protein ExbD [Methanobacterium sp.]CDG64322.1 biopolymer transport protein ExbD/TolR [Methanobacterium sp. MB1]
MAIDTNRYRRKLRSKQARVNLVPLIDVIFTILIFLMVTSSFQLADDASSAGKPQVSQNSGNSEYYLFPVNGLKTVTVNGVDMSRYIRDSAIAIHTQVIDEGEIIIKPKEGSIVITAPPGMSPEKAVSIPQT